jgi:organic hydroperoxide reductase OsmC/OhrA
MSRAKEFRFPATVEWKGGPMTVATVVGKHELEVATPAEFGSGVEGVWSPEDLLVASAATCFAVTLSAIARRRSIPLTAMHVDGTGHVGPRDDGQLGFTSVQLDVAVTTAAAVSVAEVEAAIERAEAGCLIAMALAIPVDVHATVTVAEADVPVHA